MRARALLLVSGLVLAAAVGCGSSGSSEFPGGPDDGGGGGLFGGDGGGTLGGDGAGSTDGNLNACATDHAVATQAPSYLVFVMDRSDSMADQSKWVSCSAALDAFFGDPTTQGLNASLTWLPEVTPGTQSTGSHPTFLCTASSYATPDIPMTALPSATFAPIVNAQKLQFGTPTLPALQGAGQQAQTVSQQQSGAKVIIVLATDGLPYGCTGNTVASVSAEAQTLAMQGILTYVIGVGSATTNLNTIAQAGGTGQAFIVPTGNPTQTEQAFLRAIKTIQGSLGCSYSIPAPPNGQQIDYSKVNVQFTPGGGQPSTLTYSADCSNPDGWRYDNPNAPTKIELCTQACATAQGDSGAQMNIVFGCATQGLR